MLSRSLLRRHQVSLYDRLKTQDEVLLADDRAMGNDWDGLCCLCSYLFEPNVSNLLGEYEYFYQLCTYVHSIMSSTSRIRKY